MRTKAASKILVVSLVIISLFVVSVIVYGCYNYYSYKSIDFVVNDVAVVEYGNANYKINDLVEKVEGKIISVKKDIDTNIVGEQKVLVEVKKGTAIKEIPFTVSVVDTIAPVIKFKDEVITVTKGDSYNFNDNIESVNDEIDGVINYLDDVSEDSNNYYSFSCNDDCNAVGSHEIIVTAVDKYGNKSTGSFIYEVEEPPYVPPVVASVAAPVQQPVYNNLPANPSGNDIVSIAYSLLGMPYIYGGNGPYGFDCSGFVQYVYSRVGKYVSRSSYTQLYDGYGVSYDAIQPGDIISWGTYDGMPTHSALYVGDGKMIHAANPNEGVILSDVNYWINGSGTQILSVRRIQ